MNGDLALGGDAGAIQVGRGPAQLASDILDQVVIYLQSLGDWA